MTLRNVLINLREEDITDNFFVLTKKTNKEVDNIVNEVLEQFHNNKIPLLTAQKMIVSELSKDVSQSSYKTFNYIIDFDEK